MSMVTGQRLGQSADAGGHGEPCPPGVDAAGDVELAATGSWSTLLAGRADVRRSPIAGSTCSMASSNSG